MRPSSNKFPFSSTPNPYLIFRTRRKRWIEMLDHWGSCHVWQTIALSIPMLEINLHRAVWPVDHETPLVIWRANLENIGMAYTNRSGPISWWMLTFDPNHCSYWIFLKLRAEGEPFDSCTFKYTLKPIPYHWLKHLIPVPTASSQI